MRARPSLPLVCLLLLAVGHGAADEPAEARYAAALKRGRALSDAGKHKDAIAAFEAALAARPDDATALSELGWSAFQLHDPARARRATEQALAAIKDDAPLKGATLYNLGRIEEADHHTDLATAAYRDSLAARQNAVVRARLITLAPATAAEVDPLRPTELDGPFDTLALACKDDPCVDDGARLDEGRNDAKGLKAPILAVQLLRQSREWQGLVHVAIRTRDGWFLHRGVLTEDHNGGENSSLGEPAIDLAPRFPGAGPQLGITASRRTYIRGERNHDEMNGTEIEEELLVVCAIGPSKTPSCTPAITLSYANSYRPYPSETQPARDTDVTWRVVPKFGRAGLDLTPAGPGDRKALARDREAAAAAGPHAIVFP